MDQLNLERAGPCTATHTKPVEGVVLGDGGGEAEVENHHHYLPYHLQEAYVAVVPHPFRDQDHRLPGHPICEKSLSECYLH